MRGGSGTIQNVFFDQDFYEQGDEAHISFMWSGAADNFSDSRYGAGTILSSPSFLLELTDGAGRACADPLQVSLHQSGPVKEVTMAVTHYCAAPKVRAVLADETFGTLGSMTFEAPASPDALTSKSDTDETNREESQKTSLPYIWLLVGFFILIVVGGYIAFRFAKKSMPPIALFCILFGSASFLFQPLEARADTFVAHYQWSASYYATITFGTNKSIYAPGESMTITGSAVRTGSVPENCFGCSQVNLWLSQLGPTSWSFSGSPAFFATSDTSKMSKSIIMSAPAATGAHNVTLTGNIQGSPEFSGTLSINVATVSVGF
jgi:hypothetical protein